MPRRESLYAQHPDYRVELEPCPERVRVRVDGQVLADSDRALLVCETNLSPVVYFPREDVRVDQLAATDHASFCPFKGEAVYWSAKVGGRVEENLVWSYPDPYPQVIGLRDYMAFYSDRVEWEREDP